MIFILHVMHRYPYSLVWHDPMVRRPRRYWAEPMRRAEVDHLAVWQHIGYVERAAAVVPVLATNGRVVTRGSFGH